MARDNGSQDVSQVEQMQGIVRGETTKIHEALIAMMEDMIDERLEGRLPIMGTVTGTDQGGGGKPRVRVDDEDEDRDEGFPRKLGQRYKGGDRVMLMPTRAGEYVVMGTVSTGQGNSDNVIGNDDLIDDSVDGQKIKKNSIKGGQQGQIAGGAVDTGELKDKAVTPGKLSKEYADKTHPHNDLAAKSHNHDQEYADKNHDHNDGGGVDAQDLKDLEKDIQDWVKANFQPKSKN